MSSQQQSQSQTQSQTLQQPQQTQQLKQQKEIKIKVKLERIQAKLCKVQRNKVLMHHKCKIIHNYYQIWKV
jgi:hypothetical protein